MWHSESAEECAFVLLAYIEVYPHQIPTPKKGEGQVRQRVGICGVFILTPPCPRLQARKQQKRVWLHSYTIFLAASFGGWGYYSQVDTALRWPPARTCVTVE